MTRDSELAALTASEIYEFLFTDLKGAVPEALTDAVLERLALHIRAHFIASTKPASPLPGDVTVKALEWRMDDTNDSAGLLAQSNVGTYRVQYDKGDLPFAYSALYQWSALKACLTLDEAKAAAQADYEQRILSALASPPMPGRGEGLDQLGKWKPMIMEEGSRVWPYMARSGEGEYVRLADVVALLAASRPKEDTHAE